MTKPRDPRRVRFWGWIALAASILIAVIYLLLGQPWVGPLHRTPPADHLTTHAMASVQVPAIHSATLRSA